MSAKAYGEMLKSSVEIHGFSRCMDLSQMEKWATIVSKA